MFLSYQPRSEQYHYKKHNTYVELKKTWDLKKTRRNYHPTETLACGWKVASIRNIESSVKWFWQ